MAFAILRNLLKRRAAKLPPAAGVDALLESAVRDHQAGRLGAAEESYRRILQDAPQHPLALHYLGLIAMQAEDYDLARALIAESLAANPADVRAAENLGQVLRAMGRVDEAIALYRSTLALVPEAARIHSALCFANCFSAHCDAQAVFAEHCAWARRFAPPAAASAYGNARDPGRRLRLGYVAFNFSNYINGCYLEQVFRHHDRAGFELFLYQNGKWRGPWSERLRSQAEHWREIGELDDAAAAAAIRADAIDVLVDLSGHLGDNRLLTFARRPAPVQVSWLSYPATTGLAAMDYRLTDPYCDPPGMSEHLYTEKLHRLPHTYWCYQPAIAEPPSPLPALRSGWITFGSFNAYAKINDAVIALWARLLAALPQARLFIMTVPRGSATSALRERFLHLGVAPERIEIAPGVIPDRFHEMFARADIALDPFPCNGATTTLDSLWNGVPVVTLAGDSCVSRAGVSMLSNAGLPELVARDHAEYLAIARALAADLDALQALRGGLRARLQASPIMDFARFTADLEAAYRQMWRAWCDTPLQGLQKRL
jgi:protein O-GlcNAc transferase